MATRGPGHRYDKRTRTRARAFYKVYGWSLARISRHLDVPVGTLRTWVAEFNPKEGNRRRYDRAMILADQAAGLSRAEIMARHGCSARFLSDLLAGKLDSKKEKEEKDASELHRKNKDA